MSDADKKYKADSRPACKYSPKCYQTNSDHLMKYKHPPVKNFGIFDIVQRNKKPKIDINVTENVEEKKAEKLIEETEPDSEELENNLDIKLKKLSESPVKNDTNLSKRKSDELIVEMKPDTEDPENKLNNKLPKLSKSPVINEIKASPKKDKNSEETKQIKYHEIPDDIPSFIQEKFLVTMPDDFYSFWEYYNKNNKKTQEYLEIIKLQLVGPFDVMMGKLPIRSDKNDYLLHWRHFFDTPEFQTIIMSSNSEFHIGYYRDAPTDLPCFVASNDGVACKIQPMAENLFGALVSYVSQKRKEISNVFSLNEIDMFVKDLKQYANQHKFTLDTNSTSMKKRQRKVVAKTFHEAGIVVPNKSGVGYRPLIEKNDAIKKILENLVKADTYNGKKSANALLQPIITMANIATDESDFGTGLELGLDLFSYGEPVLHNSAQNLLDIAYDMLEREEFGEIIKTHLERRRRGSRLSIANLD